MRFFSFAKFVFPLALIWPADAAAHALSCTNPSKYVYYTEDAGMASKCRSNFDGNCNWKSNGLNCRWQGSYKSAAPAKPSATATGIATSLVTNNEKQPYYRVTNPKTATASNTKPHTVSNTKPGAVTDTATDTATKTATASATATATDTSVDISTVPETADDTAVKPKDDLDQAIKEAKLSSGKVEELKITLEEIKVSNQNNAILYRSPNANLGSADPRFNAFHAEISGESGGLDSSGAFAGGLLGKGLKSRAKGKEGRDAKGRGLASSGSGEFDIAKNSDQSGASRKGEGSSATSDNPWVSYMDQTSKAGLIDRLRRNPSLRDSLRDRISELQARGDHSGVIGLMEEALAAAELESQSPNLDDLKPMSINEAFSMDASETAAQIRSLLADLDTPSEAQYLPQESLFERVSVAHRRSVVRGSLKTNR